MSKKIARTFPHWGAGGVRRRRRVRPHVLKAARRAFVLALIGIPACVYLCHCLFHMAGSTHVDPPWANGRPISRDGSVGIGVR